MAHLNQKEAFEDFRDRVFDGIKQHFPVEGRTKTLHLEGLELKGDPDPDNIRDQQKAKVDGKTWASPVYGTLVLKDNETGKTLDRKKVRVADLPGVTRRYSYVVDGQEWQVDNQWQLKPGVYVRRQQSGNLEAQFNVPNKQPFEVLFDPSKKQFHMARGSSSSIPLYPLMKVLGVDDDALEQQWGKDVLAANKEARAVGTALTRFFKADKKRAPNSLAEAEKYFSDTMQQSLLRPEATELTLGKSVSKIDGDVFLRATNKMLKVQQGKEPEDDRDSLVFKDLRSAGDFAYSKLTDWRMANAVRNKMLRKINSADNVRDVFRFDTFNEPVRQLFIKGGGLSRVASQINPVEMVSSSMQTTIMGPGGIKSDQGVVDEAKLINNSHFGFLDPIHSPESEKTGVTLHLPIGAKKKGNEPVIPLYNSQTGKVDHVGPREFLQSAVVLPDQVEWKKGKPVPVSRVVKMSKPGNELGEGPVSDAKYVMRHPSQLFDMTSNLIPFLGNNSGNRASYATHHIDQAISLKDREAPLVQVGTGSKQPGFRTFEEFLGQRTAAHVSPVAGKVVDVQKDAVIIQAKDGKKREVQLYNNFPLNDQKAVLHSTPTVKVGDTIKPGQVVADTNFTRNGQLALGTNLNVAYIPYKGYNFEDGVVISESAAKKLSSEHMHKPSTVLSKNVVTDPKKFMVQHPEAFTKDQYRLLGADGVIKPGTIVRTGDPLVVGTRPYELRGKTGAGAIRKSAAGAHTDVSLRWDSDHPGEVVGVHKNKQGEITVHVRTVEPMQVGDKLSGRHGNKGICTLIVPDDKMPKTKDGQIVEVALNPSGVPGRVNVGQVLETAASKIAKKTGQPYIVENFGRVEDQLAKVKSELKQYGLSDTEELHDPTTGLSLGKALVGPQHLLKLTHQVDKKISARGGMDIPGAPPEAYDLNLMPAGGRKTGAQSMGNLGMYALLAHGARANIREMQTWKSEGPDPSPDGKQWASQHFEVWNAIQRGDPLPTPKPTFAFQKFTDMLRASGINVEKKGNRIQLTPLTDKQVLEMSNGELPDPSALTHAQLDASGDPKPIKGGLFDPKITGGHSGKKWSHFKLAEPMPNPVFEGAIQKVLGFTENQYTQLVESEKAINPATKSFVPIGTPGSLTGGPAVSYLLKQIDVSKELPKAEKVLEQIKLPANFAEGGGTSKLDKALKKVKYLRALDSAGITAEDAYTLKNVPVLPPAMRPASVLPDGGIEWAGLNGLYKDLGALNSQMSKPDFQKYLSDEDKKEHRKGLYDGLKALMGVGMSYADREGKNKGLLLQIHGKNPKAGYFQKTLLSRRQDLTMRSTIIPEPEMGIDDVGLPTEKALTLFRPFVVKKMVDIGAAKHPLDAQNILGGKKASADKQVLKALDLVMEERPVLMKRDPALHKHSVQAFNAHRVPGRAIQIHPLVTSGYNADFDGDAMSVYVPITNDAVKEARNMFPSNNLFNEATGRVTHVPTLESALGLYKMSLMEGPGRKRMNNPGDVLKAVSSGKLGMTETVNVKGVGKTTAGRIMLASALPEPLQKKALTDPNMVLDKKGLPDLYTALAKEHRGDYAEAANKLKDLGFGMTYGAVKVPHPSHIGPNAIAAAENPQKHVKFLPVGTHSLSLDDMTPDKETRDRVVAQTQKRVDMINSSSMPKHVKEQRAVAEWMKATDQMVQQHTQAAQKKPDNLFKMLAAGVKPKIEQYQQIKLAPMLLEDAAGRVVPTPVTKSYSEGLDVSGYWTQMHGARRGAVKKVQEVQEPGAFSKQLINTTMNLMVNGRDCGTARGIALPVTSNDIYDRELAADITLKGKVFSKGSTLTPDIVAQIRSADKNAQIPVRSPLKCEHGAGLCQKCAGLAPTGKHYELGTNLGVLSAQSLGERSVQLSLKAFHTGGLVGGGGKTLGMFDRIKQLTKLPANIPDAAALSMKSGTVEKIEHDATGSFITVSGQRHFVPLDRAGRRLTDSLPGAKYKWSPPRVGQKIQAGSVLSDPNRTYVNPHDLYRATKKMEHVQNQLTNELHGIYSPEGVRRQHIETVVKAMSNLTRVADPGDAPGVLKGEFRPTSMLSVVNKGLVKQGKRPVLHTPVLKGIDVMPLEVQEDWMAKMNFQKLRQTVIEGAATGAYSDLHGTHPIPGMVYGAEFGMTEKDRLKKPHLVGVPVYGY